MSMYKIRSIIEVFLFMKRGVTYLLRHYVAFRLTERVCRSFMTSVLNLGPSEWGPVLSHENNGITIVGRIPLSQKGRTKT